MNGDLREMTFTVAEANGNLILSARRINGSLYQVSFRIAAKQLGYVIDGKEVAVFNGQ